MEEFRSNFVIRLSGIENGSHSYSIICDKRFFEENSMSEVIGGSVKVELIMHKNDKMLTLDFNFDGEIEQECVRCLDPISTPLHFNQELIVKLVPDHSDYLGLEEDDIWVVSENQYDLDLFHYIYESIALALPNQPKHASKEDGTSECNPLLLEKLAQYSTEAHSDNENSTTDPRWDALKNLKL